MNKQIPVIMHTYQSIKRIDGYCGQKKSDRSDYTCHHIYDFAVKLRVIRVAVGGVVIIAVVL